MGINSEGISAGSISKINAAIEILVGYQLSGRFCLTSLNTGQAITFK